MSAEQDREEWRWIPRYEGRVEVSSLGRVRRWYLHAGGRTRNILLDTPVVVPWFAGGKGYPGVRVRNDAAGLAGVVYAHSAVLTAFVGPRPAGMVACHFPSPDKTHCVLSNLRWDTLVANYEDLRAHKSPDPSAVALRLAELQLTFPHLRHQPSTILNQAVAS